MQDYTERINNNIHNMEFGFSSSFQSYPKQISLTIDQSHVLMQNSPISHADILKLIRFSNSMDYIYLKTTVMSQSNQLSHEQKPQFQRKDFHNKTQWSSGYLTKAIKCNIDKYNSMGIEVALLGFLKGMIVVHTLLTYLLISENDIQGEIRSIVSGLYGNTLPKVVIQIILYSIKVFEFFALFILLRNDTITIFHELCKRIIGNFALLAELDLCLSSVLLLINFKQNVYAFVLAAILYIFTTLFLLNYSDRKDVLYISSLEDSLFLNAVLVLNYLLNSLFLHFLSFQNFVFTDLLVTSILFMWYVKRGSSLIPNQSFNLFLKNIIIMKVSNSLIFVDFYFNLHVILMSNYLLKLVLCYLAIYFAFSMFFSQLAVYESLKKRKEQVDIKAFDIFLNGLLEDALSNREKDHLVLSSMKFHEKEGCRNVNCQSKSVRYDPLNRSYASVVQQNRNRQTSLKFYVKCLYESALRQDKDNTTLMLDFCEFILNEFNNTYEICKLISRAEIRESGFFEQLRLLKLKHLLQETNLNFNRTIYDGKMDMENMIIAEQNFQEITQNIEISIKINLQIWAAIGNQTVNITQIRENINKNISLIRQTKKKWSCISRYLKFQKRWKYIFMNYSFFILNERIFYKDQQEFNSINEDNFFIGESTHLFENDQRFKIMNEQLLFDKNAFYIRAFMNGRTMEFLNVSKYFEKFVEYSESQIIGSPVDILMPEEFKYTHDEKVLDWLENGYSTDENLYYANFTSFLTKSGEQIPVVKYYKLLINITSRHMLQFVCLLKVNQSEHLPIDQKQSEFGSEQSITLKSLKREFMSNSKHNMKLQNNIFIKQENLKTNTKISEIEFSKKSIRLLTFSIIFLIAVLMIVTNKDTNLINNNIIQFLNFLNLYRFPMALSKNYMKNFLNLGTQSSVTAQINAGTQSVINFNSDPLTIKTLFDPLLNQPKIYSPFMNNSFNKGLSYDQAEIYQIIISSITSLSKLPINRTGYDFTMLNMYLIPSYDHMINSTKIKFHQTFQANLNSMFVDQIIIAVVEFSIFFLIVLIVSLKIHAYFKKSKSILIIIFEFSDINIKRVRKYWQNILKHFEKLSFINKAYCTSTSVSLKASKANQINLDIDYIKSNLQKQQNISFNKKSKVIIQTKKAKTKLSMYIIIIAVSLFSIIAAVLSIELFNMAQIVKLEAFQKDGYYFLQYFPATSVLGHALMEKYYNIVYPKEVVFSFDRYKDYVSDMRLISQSTYIGNITDPSSNYYQKQKNYMFGNPCTFNPQVLVAASSTMAKCTGLENQTLPQGITTLLRECQPKVENYLTGKVNLTTAQLDNLTSALTLVAYYVTDAITTWANEFSTSINYYSNWGNIFCLVTASLIFILHLIFCENILFYFLEKDYHFVREVFDKMIPEYILSIEKVIKQRFIMEGIIRQT